MYELIRQQLVPAPLDAVFDFFRDPTNLEAITPPWLGFEFRSPPPPVIEAGTRIHYRIRLVRVPVRWQTRITHWEPPYRFVDLQERGPYRSWEHAHLFQPLGEGILMTDRVRYALPLGAVGRGVHLVIVRTALARIFDYRFHAIRQRFGAAEESAVERARAPARRG